jgi:hypothetical protein
MIAMQKSHHGHRHPELGRDASHASQYYDLLLENTRKSLPGDTIVMYI